jgi:hypothetical protein
LWEATRYKSSIYIIIEEQDPVSQYFADFGMLGEYFPSNASQITFILAELPLALEISGLYLWLILI